MLNLLTFCFLCISINIQMHIFLKHCLPLTHSKAREYTHKTSKQSETHGHCFVSLTQTHTIHSWLGYLWQRCEGPEPWHSGMLCLPWLVLKTLCRTHEHTLTYKQTCVHRFFQEKMCLRLQAKAAAWGAFSLCRDILCVWLYCFSVFNVCLNDCHWFLSGESTSSSAGLQGAYGWGGGKSGRLVGKKKSTFSFIFIEIFGVCICYCFSSSPLSQLLPGFFFLTHFLFLMSLKSFPLSLMHHKMYFFITPFPVIKCL